MQLRFVDVANTFVAFTFGFSGAAQTFEMPQFEVVRGPGATSAPAEPHWIIRFVGGSPINPDGTRSYSGPSGYGWDRGTLREVLLTESSTTAMRWDFTLRRGSCPVVLTKRYGTGSNFPRAQVFVLLGVKNAITLESPAASVNEPVLVSGVGFAPGATVVIRVDGRAVSSAPAKPDGAFESVSFVASVGSRAAHAHGDRQRGTHAIGRPRGQRTAVVTSPSTPRP